MGVGRYASRAGKIRAYGYYRAPLGKFGPEFDIIGAAFRQIVEALGYGFARTECEVLRSGINFYAGQYPVAIKQFDKRSAVSRFLA